MTTTLRYRPEIDGLRCLAVLPVILFHVEQKLLPGGYLGVDVFFVISGFLITSIILREKAKGQFSLLGFWNRRIKRILPAASFVLFAVSVFQALFFFRPDLQEFSDHKLAALFSFANIYSWLQSADYWGATAEGSPYLHYWSLSVEEQYYLFYPVLLIIILGSFRSRLRLTIISIIVLSFSLLLYGNKFQPTAAFYLLPTRMWELGAGCLLAIAPRRNHLSGSATVTGIGVLLITLMYVIGDQRSFWGLEILVVVTGTCLVIFSSSNGLSKTLLENKPAIFIGRISYSLYLWHWPVIVSLKLARNYQMVNSGVILAAVGFISLGLLSVFSYRLIEEPFRKMKYGTPITLGWVVLTGCFFLLETDQILGKQYSTGQHFDQATSYARYYDLKPNNEPDEDSHRLFKTVIAPGREASETAFKNGGIIRMGASPTPRVVVLGDSHAVVWSKVLDEITQNENVTTSLWSIGGEVAFMKIPVEDSVVSIPLTTEDRYHYHTSRLRCIEKWHPDLVILITRWELMKEEVTRDLFTFLEHHAKSVLLVESPPRLFNVENRNFREYVSFLGLSPGPGGDLIWQRYNSEKLKSSRKSLLEYVSSRKSFYFLPVADLFLREDGVLAGRNRTIYYLDDDHITYGGTKVAEERLMRAIQNLLRGDNHSFPIVSGDGSSSKKTLEQTALPGAD